MSRSFKDEIKRQRKLKRDPAERNFHPLPSEEKKKTVHRWSHKWDYFDSEDWSSDGDSRSETED